MLKVIRPEGRLTAPFNPSRSATSPDPNQEKNSSEFFDLLRVVRAEGRLTVPFGPSRSATSPDPKVGFYLPPVRQGFQTLPIPKTE
jgi:hypothetical protein